MNCRDLRVSRRRFLQGIAAAATPVIVSPAALGAGKTTPPSERVTVGIIGIGKMAGEYHLPSLLGMADVQVVAVCEVDTTRRLHGQKIVESHYSKQRPHKGCAAYNDFRELIARKDVNAVCIATPEHWHAIPAIEACKAGKDVYCEKPLTLTIREAKLCIDAVRKHGRVFQTGSQQRSNVFGQFREAAEIIRSGRLGQVKTVTVGVGGPSKWCDLPEEPMEPGLDWNLWLGAAHSAPTIPSSARGRCTTIFRPGATIASMPAAAMPTWARTTTTSSSGLWAWTTPAPSRSSRPPIRRRARAANTSMPTASR